MTPRGPARSGRGRRPAAGRRVGARPRPAARSGPGRRGRPSESAGHLRSQPDRWSVWSEREDSTPQNRHDQSPDLQRRQRHGQDEAFRRGRCGDQGQSARHCCQNSCHLTLKGQSRGMKRRLSVGPMVTTPADTAALAPWLETTAVRLGVGEIDGGEDWGIDLIVTAVRSEPPSRPRESCNSSGRARSMPSSGSRQPAATQPWSAGR